jgi:hypothetical protein
VVGSGVATGAAVVDVAGAVVATVVATAVVVVVADAAVVVGVAAADVDEEPRTAVEFFVPQADINTPTRASVAMTLPLVRERFARAFMATRL